MPDEEKSKLSAVSLRIGGITEMGVGNVGFYPSHARSSHTIGTNQENYFDRDNIKSSLEAAKCLGGWADQNAPAYSPSLSCLNVPAAVMNTFLNKLVVNTFKEFMLNGGLRPMLEACVTSLLRYDQDFIIRVLLKLSDFF